jgi:arginase
MAFEHSACTTLTGKLLQQDRIQLLIGRRHGIGRVMEMALGHIGNDTPIHLSFDVDALDPMVAPSTGTPVRGGLTLREGDYIAECVHETGSLVAMDLVEVNPTLESGINDIGAHETVRAGCSLVRCALGESLL